MADHNDPNSVNSIFSDVEASPADLYDMFGFPAAEPDTVVIASTFAAFPAAGTLDPDLLYRMRVHARERSAGWEGGFELSDLLHYVDGVKDRFASVFQPGDVRAWVDEAQTAHLTLRGFPGGDVDARGVDQRGARRDRSTAARRSRSGSAGATTPSSTT